MRAAMRVPQLDLRAQYESLSPAILDAVAGVFAEQRFILGEEVAALEKALADYLGIPESLGVASGSEALRVALAVLDIGPGDEVLLPAFTFFATAGAVVHAGARPVFVDVDEDFLMDPADARACLSDRSRAVIVVHLFGLQAPWAPWRELAAAANLALIEDAAQALGARRPEGSCGSLGDVAAFSFFPSKNLGGAGDGGLVTCLDAARMARARRYRNHGETSRYHHEEVGINGRLDALQAAVLRVKLPHLDTWNHQRRERARRYDVLLNNATLAGQLRRPRLPEAEEHVFHQYTICAQGRDELLRHLADRGVGAGVYYPVPLHRQPCFAAAEKGGRSLPNTDRLAAEVLSLPIYPELTEEQQAYVADCILDFYR